MNNKIISCLLTVIFCMISEKAFSSALTKDEITKINNFSTTLESMGRDLPTNPGKRTGGRRAPDPDFAEEEKFERDAVSWRNKYAAFQDTFEANLKGILELCVKAGNAMCNDKCVKLWDMYKTETERSGNRQDMVWGKIAMTWGGSAHIVGCHGALETFRGEENKPKQKTRIPLKTPKKK